MKNRNKTEMPISSPHIYDTDSLSRRYDEAQSRVREKIEKGTKRAKRREKDIVKTI